MKVTTSDLLAILRQFQLADDTYVPRNIDQVTQSHPSPINQLVGFRFNRSHFFALFDETATDRESYIMQQVETARSEPKGELLGNPRTDFATFGLPYKGKDVYLFRLDSGKQRLDVTLAERYPEHSRSTWQKHIKAGRVTVGGESITKPKFEVAENDKIVLDLPEANDFSGHELPIIYLDDDVIVIDKPVGVLTHAKDVLGDEFTVADFFRRYTTVGLDTDRPGIVHRLDRDTSGVMIGARTPESFEFLKQQFADRSAQKTYVAITDGIPKHEKLRIDIPIARNTASPGSFIGHLDGKPAQTDMTVLETNGSHAYIELRPRTGRTHQLRVHLAHIGAPIHGDRLYGTPADRLYLHAHHLRVALPNGTTETFSSPVPSEFSELMSHA